MNEITLLLPENEAKKWIVFQKYYDTFSILVDNNIFDVKNGSVAIHFDKFGSISLIQRADTLFNSRFK